MDGRIPDTKECSLWHMAAENAAVARKDEIMLRRTRDGDGNVIFVDTDPIASGVCFTMVPF